jgi:hypothetical protein
VILRYVGYWGRMLAILPLAAAVFWVTEYGWSMLFPLGNLHGPCTIDSLYLNGQFVSLFVPPAIGGLLAVLSAGAVSPKRRFLAAAVAFLVLTGHETLQFYGTIDEIPIAIDCYLVSTVSAAPIGGLVGLIAAWYIWRKPSNHALDPTPTNPGGTSRVGAADGAG